MREAFTNKISLYCWCGQEDIHVDNIAIAINLGWTKNEDGEVCPKCTTKQRAKEFIHFLETQITFNTI